MKYNKYSSGWKVTETFEGSEDEVKNAAMRWASQYDNPGYQGDVKSVTEKENGVWVAVCERSDNCD